MMAKQFDSLQDDQIRFIAEQHIFFTGSAGPEGRVNISPKGMDTLQVLSPSHIRWLSVTGSGNETAAHLLENPRLTLMWCSFTTRPLILRAFGTASVTHFGTPGWAERAAGLPALPGARQIFDLEIDLVQTSCGYAVPFMDYREERPTLNAWAENKGPAGVAAYWTEKNTTSVDGKPTGIAAAKP